MTRRPLPRAVVTALAAGLLLAGGVACSGGDGTDDASTAATTTASEAPSSDGADPSSDGTTDGSEGESTPSAEPSGDLEDVPTAEVGACIDLLAALTGSTGVSDLPTVDCSEEHDAQVFHIVDLADGDYPGQDVIDAAIDDDCGGAFEAFVGTPPSDSSLDFDGLFPTEETWAVGDRQIICLVFDANLDTTTSSYEGSNL